MPQAARTLERATSDLAKLTIALGSTSIASLLNVRFARRTLVTHRPFDPAQERYVSLATYRRNGAEVQTPVWIAGVGDRYYVFSARDAGKVKRLRANSRARLAACDFKGNVTSAWIDAEAHIVSDPNVIANALRALRSKYGFQMRVADFFAKLSGRFRKRAYLEIALS